MAQNRTQASDADVAAVLAAVTPERRAADAQALDRLFREVTGFHPRLWGDSIIGYGQYHYTYASGRAGDFLATGFAARKAALSLYIMPGYAEFGDLVSRLGKHRRGKACLYITRLADVDTGVLRALIRAGLEDLGRRWPVTPT